MYGYIYKTTNLYNGKIYIGQHKSDKFDDTYFGSGVRFSNVFNKFGKDNFMCEMLEECETEQELNEKEHYWIEKLNATNRNVGYNLMSGGYRVRGMKHSEETIRKIAKAKTGKHPNRVYNVSDLTKTKISNSLKDYYKTHDNAKKGVHLSNETKDKLRQANIGKKLSDETKNKMKGRVAWNKGVPMSEEAKKHLSDINTGKKANFTDEHRKQLVQRWTGKNNPNANGLSESTKHKLSQQITGRVWVSNGIIQKQIKPEYLDEYLNNGFSRGRLKNKIIKR